MIRLKYCIERTCPQNITKEGLSSGRVGNLPMNASDFVSHCHIECAVLFTCAGTMMKGIEIGRKVGCHRGAVDLCAEQEFLAPRRFRKMVNFRCPWSPVGEEVSLPRPRIRVVHGTVPQKCVRNTLPARSGVLYRPALEGLRCHPLLTLSTRAPEVTPN